jgi:hypothetical protein
MPFSKHSETLSDLSFIEHALRTRIAMLTPKHREQLLASKTVARLRQQVEQVNRATRPLEHRAVLREMLTALERRLNKLEHREGKVSLPFLSQGRLHCWTQETQISSVG